MTDREVNVPLLRKAVEWVEEQDNLPYWNRAWNQGSYVDNRRQFREEPEYWADHIKRHEESYDAVGMSVEEIEQELHTCGTAYCVAGYIGMQYGPEEYAHNDYAQINGQPVHVSEFAAELLGLDDHQQMMLFSGGNSAEDIRLYAEGIAGEPL